MAVPPPDSSSFPRKETGFANPAIAYPQAGATRQITESKDGFPWSSPHASGLPSVVYTVLFCFE